jgi:glycosyltransferase involved in cell wall biosynthesis
VDFLREQKAYKLLVIRHPLFSRGATSSIIEEYQRGVLIKRYRFKAVGCTFIARFVEVIISIFIVTLLTRRSRYVIFVGFNPANALIGILCKAIKRVNYVIMYSHTYHFKYNGYLLNTLYQLLHKLSLHKSDKIWCVSRQLSQVYMKKFAMDPDKILVVPNGVESIFMHESIKRKRKFEKLRIIFVGDLSERSGIELLMKALLSLPHKILSNLEITVIGDGPYRSILENFVEKNS